MPTAGRPKITIRLDEADLRRFQVIAHNRGLDAAGLARQLIVDHIQAQEPEQAGQTTPDRTEP